MTRSHCPVYLRRTIQGRVSRILLACLVQLTVLSGYQISAHATAAPRIIGDYDGDGKTDVAIWRPTEGRFYWIASSTGGGWWDGWGAMDDIPISGDFDGDGRTDFVIYRQNTYWVWPSGGGSTYTTWFGQEGDIPVPADYDGDQKTDVAVWRPTNGTWYVLDSGNGISWSYQLGQNGDIPVMMDTDADGYTDFVVFRPTTSSWIGRNSWYNFTVTNFGVVGDIPVVGDYDADGETDFAVYRPSDGSWHIAYAKNLSTSTYYVGGTGDIPAPGDYDGDGKTDIAVWRPSNYTWSIYLSRTSTWVFYQWGSGGPNSGGEQSDIPMPNPPGAIRSLNLPVVQQPANSQWCWSTSEQMIAGFSGVSLPACQLENAASGRNDCCTSSPISTPCMNTSGCFDMTSHGFTQAVAAQLQCGQTVPVSNPSPVLTFSTLMSEFAAHRPVAFAWSWTGGGGHEMDAVGGWQTTNGQQWVEVNDPRYSGHQDLLYTDWVSGSGYLHQRDTYNIKKNP